MYLKPGRRTIVIASGNLRTNLRVCSILIIGKVPTNPQPESLVPGDPP